MRQVRTPDGSWADVHTSPDEAAVFLGAATEQATAGLLKAATYRVVSAVPLHTLCTAIACQLLLKINTEAH